MVPDSRQIVIAIHDWEAISTKREHAVVLPPGEKPDRFDWSFTRRLPVLIVAREAHLDIADFTAALVIAAGCVGCCGLIRQSGGGVDFRLYQTHGGASAAEG